MSHNTRRPRNNFSAILQNQNQKFVNCEQKLLKKKNDIYIIQIP